MAMIISLDGYTTVYRLSGRGHFGLFLAIVNDATMECCLHVSLFQLSCDIPSSGTAKIQD